LDFLKDNHKVTHGRTSLLPKKEDRL